MQTYGNAPYAALSILFSSTKMTARQKNAISVQTPPFPGPAVVPPDGLATELHCTCKPDAKRDLPIAAHVLAVEGVVEREELTRNRRHTAHAAQAAGHK